jgi:excisionase family DNA binding protein
MSSPQSTAPLLLSARETARALSVSERTLFTLTKERGLPCVRIGSRVMYRPEAVNAWLAEREQGGGR